MIPLACVDGGLFCIPAMIFGISSLIAWLTGRKRCREHRCHDHPCEKED